MLSAISLKARQLLLFEGWQFHGEGGHGEDRGGFTFFELWRGALVLLLFNLYGTASRTVDFERLNVKLQA